MYTDQYDKTSEFVSVAVPWILVIGLGIFVYAIYKISTKNEEKKQTERVEQVTKNITSQNFTKYKNIKILTPQDFIKYKNIKTYQK